MKGIQQVIFKMTLFTLFVTWTFDTLAQDQKIFQWPSKKSVAVSLTWDDARNSQVTIGTKILDAHNVKATFYVIPSTVEKKLEDWKHVVTQGHEIGNHSLVHPCSGNFIWSRGNALEEYTLADMRTELTQANEKIYELLGVLPTEFAYPCGQTFVGRGVDTKSYVPIVSAQFSSGRTWMDEAANDPLYCDLAQLTGIEMDGKSMQQILELIESARENGLWLVLAGHEIGAENKQTTEVEMLQKLLPYLTDPANNIWVAPVGEIAAYIKRNRKK